MHAKRLQGALRMHAMWHQRGSGLQKPETLIIGDLVLIRRDIVATNKIKSVLKLTRIYSSKATKSPGSLGTMCQYRSTGAAMCTIGRGCKSFSTRITTDSKCQEMHKC
jgi:hypothetical protein